VGQIAPVPAKVRLLPIKLLLGAIDFVDVLFFLGIRLGA
jgi:hypothetical protein